MTGGPYWASAGGDVTLYLGKCERVLPGLPPESVDAVVTDPPAAIAFMGRAWDSDLGGRDRWVAWLADCMEKAARVLKPGGHLLVWSLPRTSHWTALALEDAGLEIRDCVMHLFGSGFPKSLDVSRAIDRRRDDTADVDRVRAWLDAERRKAGLTLGQINDHFGHASNGGGSASSWTTNPTSRALPTWEQWGRLRDLIGFGDEMDAEVWRLNGRKSTPGEAWERREFIAARPGVTKTFNVRATEAIGSRPDVTAPATEDAARWDGWGTALKPGQEMWWLARKPLGGRTVAASVLEFGTGALNVAACQVKTAENLNGGAYSRGGRSRPMDGDRREGSDLGMYEPGRRAHGEYEQPGGRWPANIVLTHSAFDGPGGECDESCPVAELDRQSGVSTSTGGRKGGHLGNGTTYGRFDDMERANAGGLGDTGGASRFYPVFRYEQMCALYGMLSVCERVSGAAAKSQLNGQQQGSAASAASGSPSRPGAGRPDQLTLSAATAESPSAPTPVTIPSTAHATAPARSTDWSAPPAASAGSLCDSCATAIAQSLAATQRGQSPMPTLGLPSTDAFSERILTQNLALYAEALERRGTTSTTTELTTSLGCVVAAISACITRESDSPTRRSGPPPFKYQAKAPASERPRLDDGTAHETVKPLGLISWLVRLITPPGGTVLDMFAGSGPVGEACIVEGFRCILIEQDPKSAALIRKRLSKPIQPVMFGLET